MFVICYYNNGFHSRVLTKYDKDEYLKNDFGISFYLLIMMEQLVKMKK
ncbi:hypothetical protein JTS93_06945 [Clostridium botulinum]|nr:hypothetical protein [Clostridium botulinum]